MQGAFWAYSLEKVICLFVCLSVLHQNIVLYASVGTAICRLMSICLSHTHTIRLFVPQSLAPSFPPLSLRLLSSPQVPEFFAEKFHSSNCLREFCQTKTLRRLSVA